MDKLHQSTCESFGPLWLFCFYDSLASAVGLKDFTWVMVCSTTKPRFSPGQWAICYTKHVSKLDVINWNPSSHWNVTSNTVPLFSTQLSTDRKAWNDMKYRVLSMALNCYGLIRSLNMSRLEVDTPHGGNLPTRRKCLQENGWGPRNQFSSKRSFEERLHFLEVWTKMKLTVTFSICQLPSWSQLKAIAA